MCGYTCKQMKDKVVMSYFSKTSNPDVTSSLSVNHFTPKEVRDPGVNV